MIWFHGIQAYSGRDAGVHELLARAEEVVDKEVCGADRPIGPIGVLVYGKTSFLADRDVWSYVEDGRRYSHDGSVDGSIGEQGGDKGQLDAATCERFCKEAERQGWSGYYGEYCEAFTTPQEVTGIWVKAYAKRKTQKIARVLARKFGVPLHTVERCTRVWEVAGSWIDPAEQYDVYAYLEDRYNRKRR